MLFRSIQSHIDDTSASTAHAIICCRRLARQRLARPRCDGVITVIAESSSREKSVHRLIAAIVIAGLSLTHVSAQQTTSPQAACVEPGCVAPSLAAAYVEESLKDLESKLLGTSGISLGDKIALKGRVEALLMDFRSYHASRGKASLESLRGQFDAIFEIGRAHV